MTVYVLMLLLFFPSIPNSERQHDREAEDDIREAVLRHMFEHEARQQKAYTKILFISVEKKDPDDKFIARFKGQTPPVKKVSESVIKGDMGSVVDKKTGQQGIIYRAGKVRWINENEAEVDGSYRVANLFAGGCSYRVVRDEDKWMVKECKGNIALKVRRVRPMSDST